MSETVIFSIFVGFIGVITGIIIWLLLGLKAKDPGKTKKKKTK